MSVSSLPKMIQPLGSRPRYPNLLPIGFWYSKEEPHLPKPKRFIDPSWNSEERQIVLGYLDSCQAVGHYKGSSTCRLCGDERNGSCDLADDKFVFPSGFAHYISDHHLRPSKRFIRHVLRRVRRLKRERN